MRLLIRFVLLILIVVVAYALWPRTPHLTSFDPAKVAKLETRAWQGARSATSLDGALALYQLYDRQYGLPPVSSVKISQSIVRALNLLRTAPDTADQEKALPYFEAGLAEIKFGANLNVDSSAAARALFNAWSLSLEPAAAPQIAGALAQSWSILYGKPASAFTPAANAYADALLANGFAPGSTADWSRVEASLTKAYEQLAATLK